MARELNHDRNFTVRFSSDLLKRIERLAGRRGVAAFIREATDSLVRRRENALEKENAR